MSGLAALLLLSGMAQSVGAQGRYQVRDGDTLGSVAAEFGVDPEAILAASWVSNPGMLTPGDVIVIPDPGQSPEEAAAEATQLEGTSPWVSTAYTVEAGDSVESIAGAYRVDPDELLSLNGLTWSDTIWEGEELAIPGEPGGLAVATGDGGGVPGLGSDLPFSWVPTHYQERRLSCEYASAFIATSAYGNPIPESVFANEVPQALNPHYGYRGDIDGAWGNYDDYGVYPEALVPVLKEYGYGARVFYSWGETDELTAHIDLGQPVIVWIAVWGDTGRTYDDDDTYSVFAGEHVVVAYAYDDAGIYVSDPGNGSYEHLSWSTFRWMYGASDGMSLAVYPE